MRGHKGATLMPIVDPVFRGDRELPSPPLLVSERGPGELPRSPRPLRANVHGLRVPGRDYWGRGMANWSDRNRAGRNENERNAGVNGTSGARESELSERGAGANGTSGAREQMERAERGSKRNAWIAGANGMLGVWEQMERAERGSKRKGGNARVNGTSEIAEIM